MIAIPGKMPNNCHECRFLSEISGHGICQITRSDVSVSAFIPGNEEPPNCPLCEVKTLRSVKKISPFPSTLSEKELKEFTRYDLQLDLYRFLMANNFIRFSEEEDCISAELKCAIVQVGKELQDSQDSQGS